MRTVISVNIQHLVLIPQDQGYKRGCNHLDVGLIGPSQDCTMNKETMCQKLKKEVRVL